MALRSKGWPWIVLGVLYLLAAIRRVASAVYWWRQDNYPFTILNGAWAAFFGFFTLIFIAGGTALVVESYQPPRWINRTHRPLLRHFETAHPVVVLLLGLALVALGLFGALISKLDSIAFFAFTALAGLGIYVVRHALAVEVN